MTDYRIVFEFKGKQMTRIIHADSVNNARELFLSKLKENSRREVTIKSVREIEPCTRNFNFDNADVADILLDTIEPDDYELSCIMEGKRIDENAKSELQALQDFIKGNYLTSIQITVTGDKI